MPPWLLLLGDEAHGNTWVAPASSRSFIALAGSLWISHRPARIASIDDANYAAMFRIPLTTLKKADW